MSHFGVYLGGTIRTPGVERTIPPERPEDRPPADGRMQRACLEALDQPRTVAAVAAALGWEMSRAHSWVHRLQRLKLVTRTAWTRSAKSTRGGRKLAGVYQRVTP